jgi:pimeloyl-ACP methyl ester carboxylesterase
VPRARSWTCPASAVRARGRRRRRSAASPRPPPRGCSTGRPPRPLVLAGHSTGAQAALLAALALQDATRVDAVVLAGPTVAPRQRGFARLAVAAPAAFRRESLGELVVLPDYLRARRNVLRLLRSAFADRPEANVTGLRVPLLLTAGRRDAFAPGEWLATLARSATAAPSVSTVVLPGSHNNPYTHPELVAAAILATVTRRARVTARAAPGPGADAGGPSPSGGSRRTRTNQSRRRAPQPPAAG